VQKKEAWREKGRGKYGSEREEPQTSGESEKI
jgi:hypothetical protein